MILWTDNNSGILFLGGGLKGDGYGPYIERKRIRNRDDKDLMEILTMIARFLD